MGSSSSRGPTILTAEQMSDRCGCAAKLSGDGLACLLNDARASLSDPTEPAGTQARPPVEDCAVLPPIVGRPLATIDFGPLTTRDQVRAGRIAAWHALSDIYAMGGSPVAALALLIVDSELPAAAASDVLAGMIAACVEDGVEVLGGHTVVGKEAMAGLSVVGAGKGDLLTKSGVRPGDVLMISKPLGTGLIVRGHHLGVLDDDELEDALRVMDCSNREASRAARQAGAHAATDVTGFGLLGHLAEMLVETGLGAEVALDAVPVLSAAARAPAMLTRSGWLDDNLAYCRSQVPLIARANRARLAPLLDPQTSGGLLVGVMPERVAYLKQAGFSAIGSVVDSNQLAVRG